MISDRPTPRQILLTLLLLLGAAAVAWAEPVPPASLARSGNLADLSLEQLMEIRIEKVFSASKYEQKVTRAPASVTIVTSDDIAALGHRTLADVLRSVRGLYVSDDSNYSYLGVRGFLRPGDYNMRSLVLIDGHRMNDNIYDGAYYGRENMIEPAMVERVEVIRGPSSSIYGSSAFFGVINIVTKRGGQLDGVEVSSEAGSLGTHQARVSYGKRYASGLEVLLSASAFHTDGRAQIYYPEFDQRITAEPRAANNGVAENSDGEDAMQLNATASYHDFTLFGFLSSRTRTVPTASFLGAFNTRLEKTTDHRGYLDLQYAHELAYGVNLRARASYDAYSYFGIYPSDWATPGDPPDIVLNRDHTFGEWLSTEWQLTATPIARHTVVAGFEFRENLHQRQIDYDDVAPRTYYVNDDHSNRNFGAYLQDEITLLPDLLLNVGLRYDNYPGSFGGTFNPRYGLIYSLGTHTTAKALYGQAYRAPNAYERFYYIDRLPKSLDPERIRTTELVLDHYFVADFHATLSAYRYSVSELIEQLPTADGHFYFANVDRVNAQGVEVEFEGRFSTGARARVSYARQRTRDPDAGRELTNSPHDLAKLSLIWPLAKERLTAGLELQYNGAVDTLSGARVSGFLLGNLTLTAHRLARGLELSTSIYNLFDTRYGYPGAEDHAQAMLPQPGRTFRVKLDWRY